MDFIPIGAKSIHAMHELFKFVLWCLRKSAKIGPSIQNARLSQQISGRRSRNCGPAAERPVASQQKELIKMQTHFAPFPLCLSTINVLWLDAAFDPSSLVCGMCVAHFIFPLWLLSIEAAAWCHWWIKNLFLALSLSAARTKRCVNCVYIICRMHALLARLARPTHSFLFFGQLSSRELSFFVSLRVSIPGADGRSVLTFTFVP